MPEGHYLVNAAVLIRNRYPETIARINLMISDLTSMILRSRRYRGSMASNQKCKKHSNNNNSLSLNPRRISIRLLGRSQEILERTARKVTQSSILRRLQIWPTARTKGESSPWRRLRADITIIHIPWMNDAGFELNYQEERNRNLVSSFSM